MTEFEVLRERLSKREVGIGKALGRVNIAEVRRDALEVAIYREANKDIGAYLRATKTPSKYSNDK